MREAANGASKCFSTSIFSGVSWQLSSDLRRNELTPDGCNCSECAHTKDTTRVRLKYFKIFNSIQKVNAFVI